MATMRLDTRTQYNSAGAFMRHFEPTAHKGPVGLFLNKSEVAVANLQFTVEAAP